MLGQLKAVLPFLSSAYNVRTRVATTTDANGKRNANYNTVRQPLTDTLLAGHISGRNAVSVQPIMDDGETAQWGCIDIDYYGDDELVPTVTQRLKDLGLPAYVEKSKSGAAHAYIILDRPVKAKLLRRGLAKLATWLGFRDAEIFPKQDRILPDEGDIGSFVVLPGFGSGDLFIQGLIDAIVTLEKFNELTDEGVFSDGPPCLFPVQLANNKAGKWAFRNNYLYQLGVFYRYKFPADWQDRLRTYNKETVQPSLPEDEIAALINQLETNAKCHYRCNDQPFESVCNRSNCQLRKFGVASRDGLASLIVPEGLVILDTDPPIWFMTLQNPVTQETIRCKLTTDQLQSVAKFKKRCLEVLKVIPTLPKQDEWEAIVANMLAKAEVVPVPFEMTENATLLDALFRFCLTSSKCSDPEGLLHGRVLIVDNDSQGINATFRTVDMQNFLRLSALKGKTLSDLIGMFNDLQSQGHMSQVRINVGNMQVDAWTLSIGSQYLKFKIEADLED